MCQQRRNIFSYCWAAYLKQAIYHIINSKCLPVGAVSCTQKCHWPPLILQPGCTGDICPCGWGDGEDASSCRAPGNSSANPIEKDPEDNGWGCTRMFSQIGEDVKIGKGPAGSICKHFVNDPIFLSICSRLTCQLHESDAGCSNGDGWKSPRLAVTSIPSPKAINSQQLCSDNAGSLKQSNPSSRRYLRYYCNAFQSKVLQPTDAFSWSFISTVCHDKGMPAFLQERCLQQFRFVRLPCWS